MSNGNGYTLIAVARKENTTEVKKIPLILPYEEKDHTYLANIDSFTTMFEGSRSLINFYKRVFDKYEVDIQNDNIQLKIVGNSEKNKELSVSYQVHNILQDFAVYNEATISENNARYLVQLLKKEMVKGNFLGMLKDSHHMNKMLDFRIEELKRGISPHETYIKQELTYYKTARDFILGILMYEKKYNTSVLKRSDKYDQLSDLTFDEEEKTGTRSRWVF